MKILLTGGTGFVGRHIFKKIRSPHHEIMVISRKRSAGHLLKEKNVRLLIGDLNEFASLQSEVKKFNPDVFIHAAWQGIPDYSASVSKQNLDASINIINFVINETDCKKLISSGSCFEYGKKKGICRESNKCNTDSFFAWAKHSLNSYAFLLCRERNVDLIWFRIFYVYGPGQRENSLIPTLYSAFKNGKLPPVQSPLNAGDFIYAGDVAEAFKIAAENNIPAGIYNLGSGKSTKVLDVCNIVERELGGKKLFAGKIDIPKNKKQTMNFWADLQKTKSILGWSPAVSLADGIRCYTQHMEKQ